MKFPFLQLFPSQVVADARLSRGCVFAFITCSGGFADAVR